MSEDLRRDIYRESRISQNKYTYFLLATAASAIALSLNNTKNQELTMYLIPLACAVISWIVSFFCGCRHLQYVGSSLHANFDLLKVENGIHPKVGSNPLNIREASEEILSKIESISNKANKFSEWQFRMLVTGGLCYLSWHILEMYILTFTCN